jgi:hypothetical protein
MQGLIDGELTPQLGVKVGLLTVDTDPATMGRLIKSYGAQGFPPPTSFGIPEQDLLFGCPPRESESVTPRAPLIFRDGLQIRDECRAALGKGPSDSVDWKLYAEQHYGLPLTTTEGVRSLIHTRDLADVESPRFVTSSTRPSRGPPPTNRQETSTRHRQLALPVLPAVATIRCAVL